MIFPLLINIVVFYFSITIYRKEWRKRSTTSGVQSEDKGYSTSDQKRRKSAGNVYSENESGYKSESDFRCTSDQYSHSESELKSESQDEGNAKVMITDELKQVDNNRKMTKKSTDKTMGNQDIDKETKLDHKGNTIIESNDNEQRSLLKGNDNKGMESVCRDEETGEIKEVNDKDLGYDEGEENEGENTWL